MNILKKSAVFVMLLFFSIPVFCQNKELSALPVRLCLGDRSWALMMEVKGFIAEQYKVSDDKLYIYGESRSSHIEFSVFMEKAPNKGDSVACRNVYWNKANKTPTKKDDVRMWESGNMAMVEYIVKEFSGMPFNQKNINAFIAREDVWIDIHISKLSYKEERDREFFDEILQSVKIEEQYKPDINYFAACGSMYYLLDNYKIAIGYYKTALKLQKAGQKLDKDRSLVLIDNLGMAYGLSGDLKKSKEIFEYGISQYNTYPMFYYNLACTYSEMNKLDNAIANLKKAYEYNKNMLNGEEFPDPKADITFRKHFGNEKFKKAIEELN